MAQNHKAELSPEEENKIPVFTVLKNNIVLKNIFLVDNPPSNSKPGPTQPKEIDLDQENEEMFVIGRHPDCDITVEHPSISRFHLRIHSYPSLQKLTVTDLSSVHGTWVSGMKIEARVPVELNDGDILRIGGSSRVYWLHWIPLSQAYDLDNPFVPDDKDGEKCEDELCLLVQNDEIQTVDPVWEAHGLEMEEKRHQENCLLVDNEEVELLHTVEESTGSLLFDENLEPSFRKEIPSVPLLPSDMISPSLSLFVDEGQQVDDANKLDQIPSLPEISSSSLADEVDIFLFSSEIFEEIQNPSSLIDGDEQNKTLSIQAKIDEEQCDGENKIAHSPLVTEKLSADLPEISVSSLFDKEGKPQFSTEIFEEIQNPISLRDSSIEQVKFLSPQSKTEEHQCDKEMEISQSPFGKENLPVNLSADLPEISVSSLFDKEGKPQFSTEIFEEIQNPICFIDSSNEQVKFLIPQSKTEEHQCDKENEIPRSPFGKENLPVNLPEIAISSLSDKQGLDKPLFFSEIFEEIQKPSSLRNIDEQIKTLSPHSSTEERQCDEENISQFPLDKAKLSENPESPPIRSERDSKLPSIWSRRGKPTSAVTVQTGKLTDYVEDVKENSIPRVLFPPLDEEEKEEETFTPDKENVTPNTRLFKFMEKNRKLEVITNSMSARGSCFNVTSSPDFSSGKENQTPKNVLLEQKKAKPASLSGMKLNFQVMVGKGKSDRMPFQSLPVNSSGKSKTEASAINATTTTSDSVNCVQRMEKTSAGLSCKFSDKEDMKFSDKEDMVRWTMVVDTASLLNKESRKSLQLLQGLKGTQLIIPRIVVRELDCLNRRGSLFRRKTEVTSVLQWIEDCMVKTKWWIHVQSSTEERPVAPTPPASPPRSRLSDGASMEFSGYESLMEAIVSPTAEDHILESALFFRSIQKGRLILLSNDVTLKIKAMAEGLICETAEEFRESLVNPFSERFMWSESSPRGPTWSCLDDVVLREKYNKHHCCPFKKPANWGEGAKGLKLILLHNSHYGKENQLSQLNNFNW